MNDQLPNAIVHIYKEMIGETIEHISGCEKGSYEMFILTNSGIKFRLYHEQECCENVQIEDVVGDPMDLVGCKILEAEEVACGIEDGNELDIFQWTYYKLSTISSSISIRWLGESNGFYSVRVLSEVTFNNKN